MASDEIQNNTRKPHPQHLPQWRTCTSHNQITSNENHHIWLQVVKKHSFSQM